MDKQIKVYLKWKKVYPNLTIAIDYFNPYRDEIIEKLEDEGLLWYFNTFCGTQDLFNDMMRFNISKITIVEELGFQFQDIRHKINLKANEEEDRIEIRVLPNIGQRKKVVGVAPSPITYFYIRPEDTKFYEPIVDTFELVSSQADRYSVIMEIYLHQRWDGLLIDVVGDLPNITFKNDTINPYFGYHRINCYKKCVYGKCNACMTAEKMANEFSKAQIKIEVPKRRINELRAD